jgi:Ca-activated chloride channel family protein
MKKLLTSLAVGLILAGCGESTTQSSSSNTASSTSSSNVISVVDQGNYTWTWLANQEASIIEESELYSKNYYFVLDGSGSMDGSGCSSSAKDNKIVTAKKAIKEFVATIPENDNVGLFAFDSNGISERVTLGVSNRQEFNTKLKAVEANTSTPLKTAITRAYDKIKEQAISQAGHGEYNIIIVTDGEADSGENPKGIVKDIATNSPVNIYTIGFCIDDSHSLNDKDFVNYYGAEDAASIIAGLSEVLAESDEGL